MSTKKELPQILLVEGNDDQHVIWALLEKYAIPETFSVVDSKGIDNLFIQLPVRFKQSGIRTIGIIIDADTDIASRWQHLKGLLAAQGVALSDFPTPSGTIVEGNIRFGVWIMPNNQISGMLEDFIRFLVPDKDPLLAMADSILNSIEQQHLNKYIPAHRSKALIHTWLAWQEDPGTPMGLAITKRYLTTNPAICISFLDWIKAMYI